MSRLKESGRGLNSTRNKEESGRLLGRCRIADLENRELASVPCAPARLPWTSRKLVDNRGAQPPRSRRVFIVFFLPVGRFEHTP